MAENIQMPVGRFVSGSITEKRPRDHENKPVPEEKQTYQFGIAINKQDPALPAVFQYLQGVAMSNPAHAALPGVQNMDLNTYSWKIRDGDAPGREGKVNSNTAGSYVFYFSSTFPVNCCDQSNATVDPSTVYRGCFVDMVINANNNGKSGQQAGIYLNPVWTRFQFHGEPIAGGVDAAMAFGNSAPVAMPPGASATPLAGNAPSAAMLGAQPATPPAPQAAAANMTASPSNPAPAHDFVNNAAPAPGLPGMPQT